MWTNDGHILFFLSNRNTSGVFHKIHGIKKTRSNIYSVYIDDIVLMPKLYRSYHSNEITDYYKHENIVKAFTVQSGIDTTKIVGFIDPNTANISKDGEILLGKQLSIDFLKYPFHISQIINDFTMYSYSYPILSPTGKQFVYITYRKKHPDNPSYMLDMWLVDINQFLNIIYSGVESKHEISLRDSYWDFTDNSWKASKQEQINRWKYNPQYENNQKLKGKW